MPANMAQARFTGQNAIISYQQQSPVPLPVQVISYDYQELSMEFMIRTEDRTAGNDRSQSFNFTVAEGKGTFKRFSTADADSLDALLVPGSQGLIAVWAKGQVIGRPRLSFILLFTTLKYPLVSDKNTLLELDWVKQGDFIDAPGTLANI